MTLARTTLACTMLVLAALASLASPALAGTRDYLATATAETTASKGILVVGAEAENDRFATVAIDGAAYGSTPLEHELAPGSYAITVTILGKSYTATARVESGKKTKCRAEGGALACGSPK